MKNIFMKTSRSIDDYKIIKKKIKNIQRTIDYQNNLIYTLILFLEKYYLSFFLELAVELGKKKSLIYIIRY